MVDITLHSQASQLFSSSHVTLLLCYSNTCPSSNNCGKEQTFTQAKGQEVQFECYTNKIIVT